MNVLVIICDQLRYDALGCNGNPSVNTPNIDRLASMSVNFENAFCQAPICAPARHSLATGKYPHKHGVVTNHSDPYEGMYTVAHSLKTLGYRRFQLGNMHWRGNGIDNGYEPWLCSQIYKGALSKEGYKHYLWEHDEITRRTTAGPSIRKKEEYWGYQVAQTSIKQLEEAVEREESFLSWNCFIEPHPPFYPPKEIYQNIDQSKLSLPDQAPNDAAAPHESIIEKQQEWCRLTAVENKQMKAGYYGMIELVDNYVGMMLDTMDRLELWDNTMVIFTSDHGEQLGDHNMYLKFVLRESSIHIPYMVYHPDIKAGARSELVEQVDIFPTICDYTGAKMPDGIDGKSLRPLLEKEDLENNWRDDVFSEIGTARMIRTNDWKMNVYDGIPCELFNLKEDSNEFNNLIKDTCYSDVIQDLEERLNKKVMC